MDEDKEKLKIIVDTRERQPFWEAGKEYDDLIIIRKKLESGDYAIEGLENKLVVERKKGPVELYMNFTRQRDRFFNTVNRMQDVKHKYLVIESTMDEIANPLSYRYMKQAGNKNASTMVMSTLISLCVLNNIHVIFAGKTARSFVKKLFMKFSEYHKKELGL